MKLKIIVLNISIFLSYMHTYCKCKKVLKYVATNIYYLSLCLEFYKREVLLNNFSLLLNGIFTF